MSKKLQATLPQNSEGSEERPRMQQAWDQIREALGGLKYGQVTIIVQDGVIVQIDRMERKRLA